MATATLATGRPPWQRALLATLAVLGVALWLLAVYLLSQTVQNASRFAALLPWVLLINIAGLLVLLALIVRRLLLLVQARRQRVTGSRLEARMVWMTGLLAVLPMLVVFYFSVQFISRGIDSWFGAEMGAGLNNALTLSRTALELRSREYLARIDSAAAAVDADQPRPELLAQLSTLRAQTAATELALLDVQGQVLARSADAAAYEPPGAELLQAAQQGQSHVGVEPQGPGEYIVRVVLPLRDQPGRLLSARFALESRLAELADGVDNASRQYAELLRARQPLKTGFVLSLSAVLVATVLSAIYAAFRIARHLVKPIEDLVAGTRAVAHGDFDTRLPLPANDEMGLLVHSFNDMTQRLAQARAEAARSQQVVEAERANLAVILARLSSGVISLAPDYTVQVVNAAAAALLHVETSSHLNQPFAVSGEVRHTLYQQFVVACRQHLDRGDSEWRQQFILNTDTQRVALICACTALPGEEAGPTGRRTSGYVIVFDDVTQLMQAQRDAAWGEVARRLAHEIKNPLTPIRLSAERLRQKLLPGMSEADAQMLDRATHTIVQQVDAMKDMVNAFSQYARMPQLHVRSVALNDLITEVAELYRAQDPLLQLHTRLDPQLNDVDADRDRLRQVLHNLITNALEALDDRQGRIEVRSERFQRGATGWVRLIITDSGAGFTSEVLGRAFEPYITTKPRGTGLGLAIVRKIVEEHAGRVEAENRPEGGARLVVEWPLRAAPHDPVVSNNNEASIR